MKHPNLPKPSEFQTRKDWEVAAWHALIKWCAAQDAQALEIIFGLCTTPHERTLIAKRVIALDRLRSGASYREIGRELWLTPQTISLIKKGSINKSYLSGWEHAKKLQRTRELKKWEKSAGRKQPQQYRRTKYGTIRTP